MSEPKRYLAKISWSQIDTQEHPNGEFVLHSDYARLKAEVERLRASSFVTAVPVEQYERVVKAGDAMAVCLEAYNRCKPYDGPLTRQCLNDWNAAKEGKPSV